MYTDKAVTFAIYLVKRRIFRVVGILVTQVIIWLYVMM